MRATAIRVFDFMVLPLIWAARLFDAVARAYHRLYAKRHGYFWRPCACCFVPFGGHQWNRERAVVVNHDRPRLEPVCSRGACDALYHSRALRQMTAEDRARIWAEFGR